MYFYKMRVCASRGSNIDGKPFHPDLIVHLGMGGRPQPGYVFETLVRKEGYDQPGQDGSSFPQEMVNPGGKWADLPDKLFTDLDVEGMRAAVLAVFFCKPDTLTNVRTLL